MQVKKESQQSRNRWWIWSHDATKEILMCYLLLHQKVRETRHESQFLLSSRTEQHHRNGRLVKDACSSSYSEWNVDETWTSQEWESDELMEVRTRLPVAFAQHTQIHFQNDDMDSWMIECGRCWTNPQKMQHKTATNIIWRMLLSSTLQAFVFTGKEYLKNLRSIKNTWNNLNEKDVWHVWKVDHEIYGVNAINWVDSAWQHLSLIGVEEVISLSHAKVYVFSDSVLCLWKDEPGTRIKCCLGTTVGLGQEFTTIQNFGHNWWWANGIRVECFAKIHNIAALLHSPRVHAKNEHTTRRFRWTDYLHVNVQRHLMGISKQWTGMRIAPNSFL